MPLSELARAAELGLSGPAVIMLGRVFAAAREVVVDANRRQAVVA